MSVNELGLVAAGLAAALGLFLVVIGIWVRRPPLREVGLAALVCSAVLTAWRGPRDGGDWALLVPPAAVAFGESARLVTDMRRRAHHQYIEWSCLKGAAGSIGVVVALGVALSLVARGLPRSLWPWTVPIGMLPLGLGLLVAVVATLALGLRRLGSRRQAARRPLVMVGVAMVALGTTATALASAAQVKLPASGRGSQPPPLLGTGAEDPLSPAEVLGQQGRVIPKLPTLEDPGAFTVLVVAVVVLVVLVIVTRRMQLVPPEDLVPDPVLRLPLEAMTGAPLTVQTVDRSVTVAVLDEALVELRQDADPRVAVRLAYAIVTRGLGNPQLARGSAESEGEYLARALTQLGAGAEPLRNLTELFWRARFSDGLIDESMRAAALIALQSIRAQVEGAASGAITSSATSGGPR